MHQYVIESRPQLGNIGKRDLCRRYLYMNCKLTDVLLPDLPPVKPSAIALGTAFNHGIELAVLSPLFGQTYQRAKAANTKEEFVRSREASSAAVAVGTSLVGSALQAYGVGALINATGTLSYKGAAYLGALIFAATSAPTVCIPSYLQVPIWENPSAYNSNIPRSISLSSSPRSDRLTPSQSAQRQRS